MKQHDNRRENADNERYKQLCGYLCWDVSDARNSGMELSDLEHFAAQQARDETETYYGSVSRALSEMGC